ncbi:MULTISPECIES: fumarylacetoacetate hydrolase family protein [Aneurinibacillus]|uniref:5-oxopent-3-ene-1,2,5-tricarboxylate decarboxylase / 2-hydroxyhepta-2,4-diene-1,7-dioate isomerase n=1 Tax=Aneurinibacillus thermoaerophilus TaxID=143495 RepID=A0A1G7X195_ANETH|nr:MULTISPECIES: fumarylacetoacetate hydrolase family protein [Aneurinibacillus]AMA73862.1 2-hydroxyhepta-2,4-diene-1,7-dioate isomerase [Aneurinibacillus sp. XH2]MED0674037.1 fumarylacetoacetate hydrolase family protein [Aneurinibacillus thermoaerophilus]MED0678024.1 fumarylacetoacetate hydrolase family protein [Aneurinibacillus thermoaerophilus]MED0737786.1 fumarylacetoacetate hydrolase family protein [Aneurinibacillus thermoaerophilus]MED0755774.1 fumarylacetoacetate hydrolase family protei
MKHARFFHEGRIVRGIVDGEVIIDQAGKEYSMESVQFWLPPLTPNHMIGLALNYADHAEELGLEKPAEPVLFIKPNSSLVGHKAPVYYPNGATYMHYENELAVVIGRGGRNIKHAYAYDHVSGYTIINDVTVRDFVNNFYRPPVRAKGHDTFGPMGPYFVEKENVPDVENLELRTYVNGELRQRGNTKDLMYSIPDIIEFVSSFMTLEPGDVLLTGTPKGISHVSPGDTMRLEIDGLGSLENPVLDGRTKVSTGGETCEQVQR